MITSKLGNKSDIQAIVIWACSWHLWIWLWQLIDHSRADKPLTLIRFCRHSAPEQDLSLRFPLLIMLTLPWLAEEGNTKQPEMGCVELTSQANLKLFCTFPQRSKRFSLDRRLMLLVSMRKEGAQLPSQQPSFLMALMCFLRCWRNCYHKQVMRRSWLLLSALSPSQYVVEAACIPLSLLPWNFCPLSGPAANPSQAVSTTKANICPPAVTTPAWVHALTLLSSSSPRAQFVPSTYFTHQAASSQTSFNDFWWGLLWQDFHAAAKGASQHLPAYRLLD